MKEEEEETSAVFSSTVCNVLVVHVALLKTPGLLPVFDLDPRVEKSRPHDYADYSMSSSGLGTVKGRCARRHSIRPFAIY